MELLAHDLIAPEQHVLNDLLVIRVAVIQLLEVTVVGQRNVEFLFLEGLGQLLALDEPHHLDELVGIVSLVGQNTGTAEGILAGSINVTEPSVDEVGGHENLVTLDGSVMLVLCVQSSNESSYENDY